MPYLVGNAAELDEFESIANECGANYYEFVLHTDRADAIARVLARGKWGIANSPPLTDRDSPDIEDTMNRMEAAQADRPHTIKLPLKGNDPATTYAQLLQRIG